MEAAFEAADVTGKVGTGATRLGTEGKFGRGAGAGNCVHSAAFCAGFGVVFFAAGGGQRGTVTPGGIGRQDEEGGDG